MVPFIFSQASPKTTRLLRTTPTRSLPVVQVISLKLLRVFFPDRPRPERLVDRRSLERPPGLDLSGIVAGPENGFDAGEAPIKKFDQMSFSFESEIRSLEIPE